MQTLELNDKRCIELDDEGYLTDLSQWDEALAERLARDHQIELTEAHLEIIHLLRSFYTEYQHSPAMRILVKHVKRELGPDKGRSIYLMQLFGESPAKVAACLAGLPKPDNCL